MAPTVAFAVEDDDETNSCTVTEGCTLEARHAGECDTTVVKSNGTAFGANTIEGLSGAGTEKDPYIIAKTDNFARIPANTTAYFKQTAALDLSVVSTEGRKAYIAGTFSGIYDGNNYAITGAVLPLFNYIKGTDGADAQVKNINLTSNVGTAEAAYQADNLTIAESAKPPEASGAGLVANYAHRAVFNDCVISGTLYASGNAGVGTLVGHSGTITVSNCKSDADITSASYSVGGLVGFCQQGSWSNAFGAIEGCSISDSTYSGTLTVSDSARGQNPIYGGVIGVVSSAKTTSTARVTNCSFTGKMYITKVNSDAAAGGIIGMSFPKDAVYHNCTVGSNAVFSLPDTIVKSICVGGIIGCLVRHAEINGTVNATLPSSSYTVANNATTGVVVGNWLGYFNSNSTTGRDDGMLVLSDEIIANTGALTGGVVPAGVTLKSDNLLPIKGAGNVLRLAVEQGGKIGTINVDCGIAALNNAGEIESITATRIGNNDSKNRSGVNNSGTIGSLSTSDIVVITANSGTIGSIEAKNNVHLCTAQESGTIEKVKAGGTINVGADTESNKNTLSALEANAITFYGTNTGDLGTIKATSTVSGLTTKKPTSLEAGTNHLVVVGSEVGDYYVVHSNTATISNSSEDGKYSIKDGDSDATSVSADATLIFAKDCTLTIDRNLSSAVSVGDIQASGNLTIVDTNASGNHATIKSITANGALTMNDYYETVSGDISAGGNISLEGTTGLSGTIGTADAKNTVSTSAGRISIKMASSGTLNSDVKNTGTGDIFVTNSNKQKTVTSNITAEKGTVYLKGNNAGIDSALFSGNIYAEKGLTVTYNIAPVAAKNAINVYLGNGATIQLVETGNLSRNAGAYLNVKSKNSDSPVQSLTISKGSTAESGLNDVTIDLSDVSDTLQTITNNVADSNLTVKAKITIDANGGTATKSETVTLPYALSGVTDIIREDYTLDGWNTKADGTGTTFALNGSISCANWQNTLYAQWTKSIGSNYTVNAIQDQVYTGAAIEPKVVVKNGDTVLTDNYTVSYSDNIDVGTAKATVTIGTDSTDITFKIIPDSSPVVGMSNVSVPYGTGYTMTAVAKTNAGNPIMNGAITIKYYTDEDCSKGETDTAPTNAGVYYAKATLASTDNYAEQSTVAKIDISKVVLTATYISETIRSGATPALKVEVKGFVNDETTESAAGYVAPTVSNSNTAAGQYTLTPAGGSADNYDFDYVSGTLTRRHPKFCVNLCEGVK